MKIIALPWLGTRQPTMLSHSLMNYKRHNQGYRAHVRRTYPRGYGRPSWARYRKASRKSQHCDIIKNINNNLNTMDPLQQPSIAPAPVSPPEAPGIPGQENQPELSQEQMRGNIQGLMSKLQTKNQDLEAQQLSSGNNMDKAKGEALRELFDILENMGIDPNNVEQVGAFLNKLKENNPELHQQVESSLESLLGDKTLDEPTEGTPEMDPSLNMNINTNATPQENI